MDDKITIVGPRPEKKITKNRMEGAKIEALLLMAKYNKRFHKRLISDHAKALEESGLEFDNKEKFILLNIDTKQLQSTIRSFHIPGINKKSLPQWKTAATVLLLVSSLAVKEGYSQQIISDSAAIESIPIVQGLTSDYYRIVVKGKVFDSETLTPLNSAKVVIKRTNVETLTQENGQYSIRAERGDTLVFSYPDYISQEIAAIDQTDVDVALISMINQGQFINRGIAPSKTRQNKRKNDD